MNGELEVQSMDEQGSLSWKPILKTYKNPFPTSEDLLDITLEDNSSLKVTSNHRVYTGPNTLEYSAVLKQGSEVYSPVKSFVKIKSIETVPKPEFVYDITVKDNANLVLTNSKITVHNCPDRNYRFRPPTHEGTINQFTRVFGYIWEDYEMVEYLERGVDYVNLVPPLTGFNTLDAMVRARPPWREMIIYAAMSHALMALSINWVAEEFSIHGSEKITVTTPEGDVSLTLEELYEALNEED